MTKSVCLEGDLCTGHDGYPPRPNTSWSTDVRINGRGVHRQGDTWAEHCDGPSCHSGYLLQGSTSVYCNGLPVGRTGDPISCGSFVATGSDNVFCGG